MNFTEALKYYKQTREITNETILSFRDSDLFRSDLHNHFRENSNRGFALTLLENLIVKRKDQNFGIGIEELMLASYILGFHMHVEDSLKIWEAKEIDFDTHCGMDIQLIPFAGVEETLEFLANSNSQLASDAYDYVKGCEEGGDFDELGNYFSPDKLHWWL